MARMKNSIFETRSQPADPLIRRFSKVWDESPIPPIDLSGQSDLVRTILQTFLDHVSICFKSLYPHSNTDCMRVGTNVALDKELARTKAQLQMKRMEIAALANSTSYRIGLLLTWPARKIWRAFRDNSKVDAWFKRRGR